MKNRQGLRCAKKARINVDTVLGFCLFSIVATDWPEDRSSPITSSRWSNGEGKLAAVRRSVTCE